MHSANLNYFTTNRLIKIHKMFVIFITYLKQLVNTKIHSKNHLESPIMNQLTNKIFGVELIKINIGPLM